MQKQRPGDKFSCVPFKGGTLQDFHQGVTGIVGEPHADLEKGVESEHCSRSDPTCDVPFSTPNYGITTTPRKEYMMATTGGMACRKTKKLVRMDDGSEVEHTVVSGTTRCGYGGQGQEDVRVLRPLEDYGRWAEGGVLESCEERDGDSEVQRIVKRAGLTRIEVVVIICYTGPMFVLYNGVVRGFGECGQVPVGVAFGSAAFWEHIASESVSARMTKAGHRFSSTMHCIASAIKKLQQVSDDVQGKRLYRGLGGLDLRDFRTSLGIVEKGFMSCTESLACALTYSGVREGRIGSVLCIEVSTVDRGAKLCHFSQYPEEQEEVWNACSHLENQRGKEEMHMTEWGAVRILAVKANANTRAMTIEELQARRKAIAINVFETLHTIMSQRLDVESKSDDFQKRLAQEFLRAETSADSFLAAIRAESLERICAYKDKPPLWYADSAHLGQAINDALEIIPHALGKVRLWLETNVTLYDLVPIPMRFAQMMLVSKTMAAVEHVEASGVGAASGNEVPRLALRLCYLRGLLADDDDVVAQQGCSVTEELDVHGQTGLYAAATRGSTEDVRLLVQAGADVKACTNGMISLRRRTTTFSSALHGAARLGHADVVALLLRSRADVDAKVQGKSVETLMPSARVPNVRTGASTVKLLWLHRCCFPSLGGFSFLLLLLLLLLSVAARKRVADGLHGSPPCELNGIRQRGQDTARPRRRRRHAQRLREHSAAPRCAKWARLCSGGAPRNGGRCVCRARGAQRG